MKRIVLLGSTGSIGAQALDVVRLHRQEFQVVGISAYSNVERLVSQILAFHPEAVAVRDGEAARQVREALGSRAQGLTIFEGPDGLVDLALWPSDQVLVAVVGAAGVRPTHAAVCAGKDVALANKETLVAAGHLVMAKAAETGSRIVPVDSEHSAVFQCLMGGRAAELSRIILTASGGPFRNRAWADLSGITPEDALKHPNWSMGGKITIDSATMMNKGLEVIEAHWLFNVDFAQIDVVIHPQSIVHSMVEFCDGSILAQLGWPDMRLPIQLALTFPRRISSGLAPLDLAKTAPLEFEEVRWDELPCLRLAVEAGRKGGSWPCVMNAANEIAVYAFLNREIPFTTIPQIIESVLQKHNGVASPVLDEVLAIDGWARDEAQRLVKLA